ncbi:MAG: argininosuccinate lyase, partial [Verrucomicrobiae bacterium]|nr:argininosuccinate lyase [Verrucomicrobiae bacterium]
GLPMTYNRDMQEDKEPLFDSIDTVKLALEVFAEMMAVARVRPDRAREAASDPFLLATDLADYLVVEGVPFRTAHEIVGKLTAYCLETGKDFPNLTDEEWRAHSEAFDPVAVRKVLKLENALKARKGTGAPAPANVTRQIGRWWRHIKNPPAL